MRKYNQQFLANNIATPIKLNLDGFYDYIKEDIIKGEIPSLNEAASYYFGAEGKLVRPMLNLLYHELIGDDKIKEQKIWAGVIEMLHVASLVHDDILDDSISRRGIPCSHQKFGKKAATFSANYLIGRAGRKIAEINDLRLYKIYSRIMDNLTNGEYLQALKHRDYSNQQIALQNYMIKTYYKTAALMANSLEGVGVISPTELDGFNIGLHLGDSHSKLIDDVLDYTSSSAQLGKPNLSDLKSGVVTGPVLLEYYNQIELNSNLVPIMNKVLEEKNEKFVDQVNKIVLEGTGIERQQYLAFLHAQQAIDLMKVSKTDPSQLISLMLMILKRNK